MAGTRQVCVNWCERDDSYYEWQVEHGDMAGHMVPGVQGYEAYEEGGGYHPGREDVIWWWARKKTTTNDGFATLRQ